MGTINQSLRLPKRDLELNRLHQTTVKKRIRAAWLIGRLTKAARGKITLTDTQFKAIQLLLNKVLPDAPREIQAQVEGTYTFTILTRVPETIDSDPVSEQQSCAMLQDLSNAVTTDPESASNDVAGHTSDP